MIFLIGRGDKMAENDNDNFIEILIISKEENINYKIPSFPAINVELTHVKYEVLSVDDDYESNGLTILYDGFVKKTEEYLLLPSHYFKILVLF